MSQDEDGRSHAADRDLLLAVMEERTQAAPAAPVWSVVRARMLQEQRRRRIRAAAAVSAGVVVLSGAGALLLGAPGTGPGVPRHPVSAMSSGPGHAAAPIDATWTRALQRHAVADGVITVGDGGPMVPPDPATVKVLLARDIGAYRVALVRGTWTTEDTRARSSALAVTVQRWFAGPAGASPGQLTTGAATVGADRVTVQLIQPGAVPASTAAMRAEGLAVVYAPSGAADVRLAGPAHYPSQGIPWLVLPRRGVAPIAPGVYSLLIPPSGGYMVQVDGSTESRASVVRQTAPIKGSRSPDLRAVLADSGLDLRRAGPGPELEPVRISSAQRGGPVPPQPVLDGAARVTQSWSGLSSQDSTISLISALPYRDSRGRIEEWSVLMAVAAPSGARFIGAAQILANGQAPYPGLQGWALAPRGSLDGFAIAWPNSGVGAGLDTPAGSIRFLGPRAAVTAQILDASGQVIDTVPVSGGIAVNHDAARGQMKVVRFLDSSGADLFAADVLPYTSGSDPLPYARWPAHP